MKKRTYKVCTGILCAILCACLATGCGKKEKEDKTTSVTPESVSAKETEYEALYIKNGDEFTQAPSGRPNFKKMTDDTDSERMIAFLNGEDAQIPTLYKGDELVLKTKKELPEEFEFERYENEGYTIGISGLEANTAGKACVEISKQVYVEDSSFWQAVRKNIKKKDVIIIDRIDGKVISPSALSLGGTILGMSSGQTHEIDYYIGTEHSAVSALSDTHYFTSFEQSYSGSYEFRTDSYIIIEIPETMVSGYYYVQGMGFIRYADAVRGSDISKIDYNSPDPNAKKTSVKRDKETEIIQEQPDGSDAADEQKEDRGAEEDDGELDDLLGSGEQEQPSQKESKAGKDDRMPEE